MWRRLGLAWLLLSIPGACSRPDDQALRRTIAEMKQAAEALKWDDLLGQISRDYKDGNGNNYFVISRMLKNSVSGVTELEAEVEIMGLSLNGDQAEMQIKLIARGKRGGRLFFLVGQEDQPEYPRLWFKKEGRHWRLLKVEGIKAPEDSLW